MSTSHPEHLIFLVNGLWGSSRNWKFFKKALRKRVAPERILVIASNSNGFLKTYEGVDVCGNRLAAEIKRAVEEYKSLKRISLIGHSMGGLICRYAAGRLFQPGSNGQAPTIAGLAPCHFLSLATPHLGCAASGPAEIPFWANLGAKRFWTFMSVLTLRQSGIHMFCQDASDSKLPLMPEVLVSDPRKKDTASSGGHGELHMCLDSQGTKWSGRILSVTRPWARSCTQVRLTQNVEGEGYFWSALASFVTRTCFANVEGDQVVAWTNASLRRKEELPYISYEGRRAGIVQADPLLAGLSAGWKAVKQQPEPKAASPEAGVGEAAANVVPAPQPAGKPGHATLEPQPRVGSSSAAQDPPSAPATADAQHPVDGSSCGAQELPPVTSLLPLSSVVTPENGESVKLGSGRPENSKAAPLSEESSSDLSEKRSYPTAETMTSDESGGAPHCTAPHRCCEPQGQASICSLPSCQHEAASQPRKSKHVRSCKRAVALSICYTNTMLERLKQLSWRRVDVSFEDAALSCFAHTHIQQTRPLLDRPGSTFVKGLAQLLSEMESYDYVQIQ